MLKELASTQARCCTRSALLGGLQKRVHRAPHVLETMEFVETCTLIAHRRRLVKHRGRRGPAYLGSFRCSRCLPTPLLMRPSTSATVGMLPSFVPGHAVFGDLRDGIAKLEDIVMHPSDDEVDWSFAAQLSQPIVFGRLRHNNVRSYLEGASAQSLKNILEGRSNGSHCLRFPIKSMKPFSIAQDHTNGWAKIC